MPNEEIQNASVETGSATAPETGAGQAETTPDYEKLYKELEVKLGEQGTELGQLRTFVNDVYPTLEKLGDLPKEFIDAIQNGNINAEVAKSILEGKVTPTETAEVVTAVVKEVKAENKGNTTMTQEDIDKIVEARVAESMKKLETSVGTRLAQEEDLRKFEKDIETFINETSDFDEYLKDIDVWLDEHDSTDLRVAYYAVKGELSEKEAKKQAEIAAAEEAKKIASNAGGGGGGHEGIVTKGGGFSDFVTRVVSANDL